MTRLQILELPEGAGDERPPFVLVVDECAPQRVIIGMDHGPVRDYWSVAGEQIGARGVVITAETVDIPANDLPQAEPFELVADADRMDQITDALGLDRLRDWDEIVAAIKLQRRIAAEGGHEFGGPGFNDPVRCSRCGLDRLKWATRRDVPTCVEVWSTKGGE